MDYDNKWATKLFQRKNLFPPTIDKLFHPADFLGFLRWLLTEVFNKLKSPMDYDNNCGLIRHAGARQLGHRVDSWEKIFMWS